MSGRRLRACAVALILALTGLCSAGSGEAAPPPRSTIVIGAKGGPEEALLGELYRQALQARGFHVVYRPRIGPTPVIDAALARGRIDMYLEHTGSLVEAIGRRARPRTAAASYLAAKRLEAGRDVTLLAPARFVDAQAIVMLRATAARLRIRTIGALRAIPDLELGVPPGLDGTLAALRSRYRLRELAPVPLAASPLAALDGGFVQAAVVPARDPRLEDDARYAVLADPRRELPRERVAPAVRADRVGALGPGFVAATNAVSRALTGDAIAALRSQVLVERKPPREVANEFLKDTGLVSSANVFVAPNGSDTGASCRRFPDPITNPDPEGASLCRTFDRTYRLASPGDTIEVEPGDYTPQTISAKPAAAAPNVVVKPSTAGDVTLADLVTSAGYLTVEDMEIATGANHLHGWHDTGSGVVLDGVRITGPYARVAIDGGASGVTWRNGGLGTPGNTAPRVCGLGGGASGDPEPVELGNVSDLTFSNLDFYPFLPALGNPACGPDATMHLETIRVNDGVERFRLERSRFHRGDGSNTARLFVTKLGGANSDDLVVVNTWFGAADGPGGGSYSVVIGHNQACVGYVLAYDHFEQGVNLDCDPMTSLTMVGNTGVGPWYLCQGTSRVRNLWTWSKPGSCGSDRWVMDTNFSVAALRYAPDGYHLLPGSPAIDAGDTAECRALTGGVDIDGQQRTGTCDAGPDEYVPR